MSEPNLYDSMAAHPDIAPVLDLLKIVDPVDEFSSALCLVRDCFSPNNTLRTLSRRALQRMLNERLALLRGYETAVTQAAGIADFGKALAALPREKADELKKAYAAQVAELMGRPLKKP